VEAEKFLSRAFEMDPNNTEILLPLGLALLRQEKIHLAVATLARAVALSPKNADSHRLLGVACSSAGWSGAAEAELKRAFELDTKNPEPAYNLAVLLATLDKPRFKEAKDWYDRARALGAQPDPGLEKVFSGQ